MSKLTQYYIHSTSIRLSICLLLGMSVLTGCTGSSGQSSWAFWKSAKPKLASDPFGLDSETSVADQTPTSDPRLVAVEEFLDREVGPQSSRSKTARMVLDEQPAGRLNISDDVKSPAPSSEPKQDELPHIAANNIPAWARVSSDGQQTETADPQHTQTPWYANGNIELASAENESDLLPSSLTRTSGVQAPSPIEQKPKPQPEMPQAVVVRDHTPAKTSPVDFTTQSKPAPDDSGAELTAEIQQLQQTSPTSESSISTVAEALLAEISRRETEAKLRSQLQQGYVAKPPLAVPVEQVSTTTQSPASPTQSSVWPQIVPNGKQPTQSAATPAKTKTTQSIVFDHEDLTGTWKGNRPETVPELPNQVINKDPKEEFFRSVVLANKPTSVEHPSTSQPIQQITSKQPQGYVSTAQGYSDRQTVSIPEWAAKTPQPVLPPSPSTEFQPGKATLPELKSEQLPALPPINSTPTDQQTHQTPVLTVPEVAPSGFDSTSVSLGGPVLVSQDSTPVAPVPPAETTSELKEQLTLEEQFARAERSWDDSKQSSKWPVHNVIWMAVAAVLASLVLRVFLKR